MSTLRLGIDVDGVLADFNGGYRHLFTLLTGVDRFNGETDPPVWNYHTHYGYTDEDASRVWTQIKIDNGFWERLEPLPGATTFLTKLFWRRSTMDIYFITTRVGREVKPQTERWLARHGFPNATVLIATGDKGAIAAGLGLTHFLDDRPENLFSLPPGVDRCLLPRNYNTWAVHGDRFVVVPSLAHFAERIGA